MRIKFEYDRLLSTFRDSIMIRDTEQYKETSRILSIIYHGFALEFVLVNRR